MPQWLLDLLANPWVVGIGVTVVGGLVLALILAIWGGLRRLLLRGFRALSKPLRGWRLTRDPKIPKFVPEPRWELRIREQEKNIYGAKNVGGPALHVRIRAERDDVNLVGMLDYERVEHGDILPFGVDELYIGGIADTWIVVSCKDAAGRPVNGSRVKIPGLGSF